MIINGPYGTLDTKTQTFKEGWKAPDGEQLDETSDVETAGYRTLSQRIKELQDAGERLKAHRRAAYPHRDEK